jgi:hypothetical protein
MIPVSQVEKTIAKLLYSVIEHGVCRIVTCQQPKILDELKSAYSTNLPASHRLLWLRGNINNLEQLSLALIQAGVPDIRSGGERHELVQQIKAYLAFCQQQHRSEIWIFENAERLPSQIYQLLGELVNWQHLGKALFSFELWGNAQLDALYHSGQLQACCSAQHYYIPVGQPILSVARPTMARRAVAAGLLIFALGIILGKGYHDWTSLIVDQLASEDIAPPAKLRTLPAELTPGYALQQAPSRKFVAITHQPLVTQISANLDNAADLMLKETTQVNVESVMDSLIEHTADSLIENTLEVINQGSEAELSADAANNRHWFHRLSYSQWRKEHQINLSDDIDRQDGLFYLQLGIYKRQKSLSRFFNAKLLPSQTYYFCYLEKNKLMALMTGSYPSARQAYNAVERLQAQGVTSTVVAVSQLKQWQCRN